MKKNKILALLLALVMIVSLAPTAFAADNDITTAEMLKTTLNNVVNNSDPFTAEGTTVKLTADATIKLDSENQNNVKTEAILDLGGHTLTVEGLNYTANGSWCAFEVYNKLTVQHGTIKVTDAEIKYDDPKNEPCLFSVEDKGNLILGDGLTINVDFASGEDKAIDLITVSTSGTKSADVTIAETATININDSTTAEGEEQSCAIFYFQSEKKTSGKVNITVNGAINVTGGTGIIGYGKNDLPEKSVTITIGETGSVASDDLAAIYIPDNADVVVNGTVTGATGIVMKGGSLTVGENATITGNGKAVADEDYTLNDGSYKVDGSAIQIESNKTGYNSGSDDGVQVDIQGGTVTSENGNAVTQFGDVEDAGKLPDIKVSGGDLKAAEGKETLHIVENETLKDGKATPSVSGGTFTTKDENENDTPDLNVAEYVSSEHAVDPSTGTVGTAEEVPLQIIDFGFVNKSDFSEQGDDWVSPGGINYKTQTANWGDATFYWCFNRLLKEGEVVTVTFTGPDGTSSFSDDCQPSESPRYASSFLNKTQNDENTPLSNGDWTISGKAEDVDVAPTEKAKSAAVSAPEGSATFTEVGFLSKAGGDADHNAYLTEQWKSALPTEAWSDDHKITDCGDDILYAIFKAAASDKESGGSYTVTYSKGEKELTSDTLTEVKNGAIVYYNLETIPKQAEPYEGQYIVTLKKDDTVVMTDPIEVYKVVFDAGEHGKFETEPAAVYVASAEKAKKATKPDVTANGGYRFSGWSEAAVDDTNYTVTYTAQYASQPTGGPSVPAATVNTPASTNGTYTVNDRYAKAGDTVTVTPNPNEGFVVDQVVVTDKNGNEVTVTDNGDGTYSFVMPGQIDLPVTVKVTFKEDDTEKDCPSANYTDVDQTQWYHEGVDYAIANGLMDGVAPDTFAPNGTTTRAMVVMILYRLDGKPAATASAFADVPAGQWYTDAIGWAAANGVVDGYSPERFGPNDPVTREQMAAILYRYASYKGYDVTNLADLSGFTDAGSISGWAETAMKWAVGAGLIEGRTPTTLVPGDTSTRAEVATLLMRFCEEVVKK